MEIRFLGASDAPSPEAWDRFVQSSPDGSPFHLMAWKQVVEQVFGHAPHYIAALSGDEIRGVLPLFEVRGLRSGRCLSSVPYGVYGGICGSEPESSAALIEAAGRLGEGLGVRFVELRQLHHPYPDLPTRQPFATFIKALDPDPEMNLRAIPRQRRRMIRKGQRFGLEARRGWEPLCEFYELYAIDRRRLGAPPFPRRFFEAIRDRFGPAAELLSIWHEGRMVAGVLSFYHRDQVLPYYGASLPDARPLAANDFMYWELMSASCLAGCRSFDFGQSHEGAGTYDFKRHWGFEPEPISHQFVLVRESEAPALMPHSGTNLAVEAWKRLPLPITKLLGPALIRWLPLH